MRDCRKGASHPFSQFALKLGSGNPFIPPRPTIPSPSLVVINMRKVAVRAPPNASGTGEGARPGGQTPRQQGVTRGENFKTGGNKGVKTLRQGVTRRWLILSLATPVKVNSHRCFFATGSDKGYILCSATLPALLSKTKVSRWNFETASRE